MFRRIPKRLRLPLKLALIMVGCTVLYINWPALRGRECSGLTRTRDAITIGYYKPLILEAAKRDRIDWQQSYCSQQSSCSEEDIVSEDAYLTTISLAMDYFAKCTAERGMEYCKYVGTDPQGSAAWSEGKGGPSEDEMDNYRYVVSGQEAGQNFSMVHSLENTPISYAWWQVNPFRTLQFRHGNDWQYNILKIRLSRCVENPTLHRIYRSGFGMREREK